MEGILVTTGILQLKKIELAWPRKVLFDLKVMAFTTWPYEACGLIHEHNIIHQYPNTFCGDKRNGFDLEVDIHDPTIRAVWHSHPFGPDELSPDDYPCMQLMIEHGFRFPWIIVTPRMVTEWVGLIY